MPTHIYMRNAPPDLVARLDAYAEANSLSRISAAKFLLNKALTGEGYPRSETPAEAHA